MRPPVAGSLESAIGRCGSGTECLLTRLSCVLSARLSVVGVMMGIRAACSLLPVSLC
jgi:hypothetical protein